MNKNQLVRYKVLDRCFRDESTGYDINDLIRICTNALCDFHADPDIKVARRTIEKDISDMKLYYQVEFDDKTRRGKKKLYRYKDTSFFLMNKLLADGTLEKGLLKDVLETLSLYDDVPQYRWLYMFLQQRANGFVANDTKAIEFQNNPDLAGMEHFNAILSAIVNKRALEIVYQPYYKTVRTNCLHPYLLKQFNDRWFLICRREGYDSITNYAIDRIKSVKEIDLPYREADIDLEEFFSNIIGVSWDEKKPVEEILLRISKTRYPYIESKPFHSGQTLIHKLCDEHSKVIRLKLQVNNELVAKILSLGKDAEVLAPAYFREQMKAIIAEMAEAY